KTGHENLRPFILSGKAHPMVPQAVHFPGEAPFPWRVLGNGSISFVIYSGGGGAAIGNKNIQGIPEMPEINRLIVYFNPFHPVGFKQIEPQGIKLLATVK